MIIISSLFIIEYNANKDLKDKLKETTQIANQNLAAASDSSVKLELTKNQLRTYDYRLYRASVMNDSILKIKSKTVTVSVPIYIPIETSNPNKLGYDSLRKKYNLTFTSKDSVRTFSGISYFSVNRLKNDSISILSDTTKIENFKFNFALVLSQYIDTKTNFTKNKIIPYFVDSTGNLTNQISENLIKFDIRGVDLLDKEYTKPVEKTKRRLVSKWGLTLSPIAVGLMPTTNGFKLGYVPNIGISYIITLGRK